jgi:hypothetical protein
LVVVYWLWLLLPDFIFGSSGNGKRVKMSLFFLILVLGGLLLMAAVGVALFFFLRDREK